MNTIKDKISELADNYSKQLRQKIDKRIVEMKEDDKSHYLIYRVLGIIEKEGNLIDIYQNKGRFLYKYAGSFLEVATMLCFEDKFKDCQKKVKIPNQFGLKPKTFEIDGLIGKKAYEIKWRDATTDGDHITKEHTRVQSVKKAGYKPIRIMFYSPNRTQAIKIQETLKTLYTGVNGEYYFGKEAWNYIKKVTDINLLGILQDIANKNHGGRA